MCRWQKHTWLAPPEFLEQLVLHGVLGLLFGRDAMPRCIELVAPGARRILRVVVLVPYQHYAFRHRVLLDRNALQRFPHVIDPDWQSQATAVVVRQLCTKDGTEGAEMAEPIVA